MWAIERFWNIVHYSLYVFDYRVSLSLARINPIVWFLKLLPFSRRRFERLGVDPDVEISKVFKDPAGITSWFAFGYVLILLTLVCMALFNLFWGLFRPRMSYVFVGGYIGCVVVSFLANHFLLYAHDRYLAYFAEFEKMPKKWKRKWAWITVLVVISILSLVVVSFVFGLSKKPT